MAISTTIPCAINLSSANFSTIFICCSFVISIGNASSNSLQSCASFARSIFSTAFHNVDRFAYSFGALSGKIIFVYSTQFFRVKSCSTPSYSFNNFSPDLYAAAATDDRPELRPITFTEQ